MKRRWLRRLFRASGLALPLLLVPPTAAQEPPAGPQTTKQKAAVARQDETGVVRVAEEVTVTGTLIPRKDLESLSPVAVLTPEEIAYQGTTRVEDLIQALPQVFRAQNSTIANGASGTATVDLRGLGPVRTLVLIDGRRLPPGDAMSDSDMAADLNFIPSALVKRVDVLTGGASSVYGADAVAGVVNFVLDTDFEGIRGGIQYNVFQHDNSNGFAQDINKTAGFDYPSGGIWDGGGVDASLAVGGKLGQGRGHASAYVDFRDISAVTKSARDYLNCSVNRGPDGLVCSGSPTIAQGRFVSFDPSWRLRGDYVLDLSTGNTFEPYNGEVFNYGPYNYIQRPDRRWSGGGFAKYTVNRHVEPYAEVMFMEDYTDAQIAPTGNFGLTEVVNCDNPMLSPQQRDLLCTRAGFGPNDYANVVTLRRNVEGGPRAERIRHTSFRLVGGARGDIGEAWSYDVYGLHAEVSSPASYVNDFAIDRIGDAMDVVGDPNDPGTWRCRSGNPGCAPWNIFQAGGVTRAALDYMTVTALRDSGTTTQMVNATVRGDLERYGVAFPSASEGVRIALGAEIREESLYAHPDEVYQKGAAGFGGGVPAVDGSFNVKELFAEALVPVVQDARGAQDLSLELGYRYADYNLSGGNSSYKAMLAWAPISGLKLRAGFNRAVRAPNVRELFVPQTLGLGGTDPCQNDPATGVPSATLEQCLRTGLSASQYGKLPRSPQVNVQTLGGGNPNLHVETANTLTVGLVWTPPSIPGLAATIDYHDIALDDTIGWLGPSEIIQRCADTGDPVLCGLIHRDSAGTLWLLGGYVESTNQNIGRSTVRGVDVSASYPLGLGRGGFLSLSLLGTYSLEYSLSNRLFFYDCVGYYGVQCGQPAPRWRHRVRVSWQTKFKTTISLGWRFIGSTEIDDASPNPDLGDPDLMESWRINGVDVLPACHYLDLAATYSFRKGLQLTFGINNLLDEDPPLASWGPWGMADGNGFMGMYDPLGRTVYANLRFDF